MQDLKDGKVTLPLIIAVNSTTITNRKKAKIILKIENLIERVWIFCIIL